MLSLDLSHSELGFREFTLPIMTAMDAFTTIISPLKHETGRN